MSVSDLRPRDPIAEMLDFHQVAREQVAHLRRIAEELSTDGHAVAEAKALAETIVRELGTRRILHEQDEMHSLLPRLAAALAAAGETDRAVTRQIAEMQTEHAEWEAVWRPIQFWLWMVGVDDPIVSAEEIGDAVTVMEEHLLGHIAREEATVYATAERLLGADARAEMRQEMDARRIGFSAFGPAKRQT